VKVNSVTFISEFNITTSPLRSLNTKLETMTNLLPTPAKAQEGQSKGWIIFGLPLAASLEAWNQLVNADHQLLEFETVTKAITHSMENGFPFLCKVNEAGNLVCAW
jgi:hypothetical protein